MSSNRSKATATGESAVEKKKEILKYPRAIDSDEAEEKKAKVEEIEDMEEMAEVGVCSSESIFSSIEGDEVETAAKTGISTAVAAGFGFNLKPFDDKPKSILGYMKSVAAKMLDIVMIDDVPTNFARTVLETSSRYEEIIMSLVAENEKLRGKLEVYEKVGMSGILASRAPTLPPDGGKGVTGMSVPPPTVAMMPPTVGMTPPTAEKPVKVLTPSAFPVLAAPKPVETWSVVVKGKGKAATSTEVMEKVVKEVGPTLGVRVHEMRPIKSGGAVIRTPSVAEREKLATNAKFSEVGLEVSANDKLGPKVVVQRVHPEITPDEFMEELYSWNFKSTMSPEEYRKKVRLVTGPWKPAGTAVNIVLEGSSEAMQLLLDNGRCYIKWFSFVVRAQDAIPSCYRCLSFDHMVRDCKMKDGVCRFCGEIGHLASRCINAIKCRNCAFKRLPADHLMMSASCPIYSAIVARQNARH